jgi:hypothetical protein
MFAKVRSVVTGTIYLPIDKDHVTSRTLFWVQGGGGAQAVFRKIKNPLYSYSKTSHTTRLRLKQEMSRQSSRTSSISGPSKSSLPPSRVSSRPPSKPASRSSSRAPSPERDSCQTSLTKNDRPLPRFSVVGNICIFNIKVSVIFFLNQYVSMFLFCDANS